MTEEKPSARTALQLFRTYDAPLPAKLRMVVRNNFIKMRTRKNCCGHNGEPGCCISSGSHASGDAHPHDHQH